MLKSSNHMKAEFLFLVEARCQFFLVSIEFFTLIFLFFRPRQKFSVPILMFWLIFSRYYSLFYSILGSKYSGDPKTDPLKTGNI